MPNYFIAVRYNGRKYAGFQTQENALTIQGELEKALEIFFKEKIQLTGSSRTDAGVHARKNYFHFSSDLDKLTSSVYNINSILPADIAVLGIYEVPVDAHARFSAIGRAYSYHLYDKKNPFLNESSWYYPYPLDIDQMNAAANEILGLHDFTSFSKRNTQVFTHNCTIEYAEWMQEDEELVFRVRGNRFLRGMVRALVGTMVKIGRGKLSMKEFGCIIAARDNELADFSAPAHGLFLEDVQYPPEIQKYLNV